MEAESGEIELRVRYVECDPMGVAHHTVYPVWFELGRTELLRARGFRYRDFEDRGIFLAVTSLGVKYRRAARYDDLLTLSTMIAGVGHARIEHRYELMRDRIILAEGSTTLACLDRDGRPRPLPDELTVPR